MEVEPFFIEFCPPICPPICPPKAVFEAKSTVGAGTKKRLSKGVQRPFKRRGGVSFCWGQQNGLKAYKIKVFCRFQVGKLNLWQLQLNFWPRNRFRSPASIKAKLKQIVLFNFRRFCLTPTKSKKSIFNFCIFCFYALNIMVLNEWFRRRK